MFRVLAFLFAFAACTLGVWGARSARVWDEDLLPLARPPAGPVKWSVAELAGAAQKLSPDGEWVPLASGDVLGEGEQLRTTDATDGRMVLRSEGGEQVVVGFQSQLAVRRLRPAFRFRCVQGLLSLESAKGSIEVELRPAEAVVTGQGRFAVLCSQESAFIHAADGTVSITVGGKVSRLAKGEVMRLSGEPAELVAEKMGEALEVKVVEPQRENRIALVTGTVNPASRVLVGGVPARVDDQGNFSARVLLHEGENRFTVVASDVAGRERTVDLAPIALAPPKPTHSPKPPRGSRPPKPRGGGDGFTWGVKK